jgi:hypothetical protein
MFPGAKERAGTDRAAIAGLTEDELTAAGNAWYETRLRAIEEHPPGIPLGPRRLQWQW